jgi:outer membrane protein assembly factor BamB
MRVVIAPLLVTAFASLTAIAPDWPAFRGPGGQGHSNETGLPAEWSEATNLLWKAPVPGLGWSSPVVAGGRVWLTSATGEREVSLRVLAFDVESGKPVVDVELERIKNPRHINQKNSWASPTPLVEGDRVYVHFGAEGTAALTTSGEIVWKKQFSYESQHGAGGSPVLTRIC